MKVRIDIDTRTFIRFWLVVFAFAGAILAIYSARTALVILGISFFLALALDSPVNRISKYLPGRSRTLSTAIAFFAVITFLSIVLFLVIPPIVEQTMKFIEGVPTMVRTLSEQWKGVGDLVEKYHIQPQVDKAIASIQADAGNWATGIGKNFLSGIGSVMSLFAAALLVLVLTFLMLVEGPMWMKRIWSLYPDERRMKHHQRVVSRMRAVVSGYVSGQLIVSGTGALAAGITVFILSQFFHGVPANLAFPTIAICFLLSLIPMFGATIAGIIVAILLAFNSIAAGVIFVAFFMIYQQIENNIVSPRIQSKHIELSALAVLAAVTIGLYMFGVAGGIISIPIAGCIKVLIEEYLAKKREPRSPTARLVKSKQA